MKRRDVLRGLAASPLLMTANALGQKPQPTFEHGVASGDPDHTSVVIWTRVSQVSEPQTVLWQVSKSATFDQIIASGETITNEYFDYTVKVVVEGLQANNRYNYRFQCGPAVSVTGMTRTLPMGRLDTLGLAIASCSNYAFGYFNAYDAIAKDEAVDFVLHLGDYLYEYGATEWGVQEGLRLNRSHKPIHEIVSLADYRERHAQYKSDPDSQKMHAAKPLLLVWDDHESTNNPWVGGAQNHQFPTEGNWLDRRDSSIRAYYEWMPIREPDAGLERREFWRAYQFGDLAHLITVESRHTARSLQVDYGDYVDKITTQEDAAEFQRAVLGAPDRLMLSEKMEQFLMQELAHSTASDIPWRLMGNAIPMAKTPVPDLESMGFSMPSPSSGADLLWKGRWNLPFYPDTWDGYPWARERLYQMCKAVGVQDLVVLTGDSHSFWANHLTDESGESMGVELGTTGISSPGDFVEQGFDRDTAALIDAAFMAHASDIRWTSNLYQGYLRLVLDREMIRADYVAVSTVELKTYSTKVIHSEKVARRSGRLSFL